MKRDQNTSSWEHGDGDAPQFQSKLTDDDIYADRGRRNRRNKLEGKIRERYGLETDDAELPIAKWQRKAGEGWPGA